MAQIRLLIGAELSELDEGEPEGLEGGDGGGHGASETREHGKQRNLILSLARCDLL